MHLKVWVSKICPCGWEVTRKKKDVFDLLLNSGDITKTLSGFISSEFVEN